ncbi:MAG: pyridoxamine 5'-phosphate oxidase family protein [Candidatus Omnitrophica bacterium]|nr:pyridoxamine 5'-phosphate oxidase family protein [Candidatus Omnitrophota bacterium]
MDAAESVRRLVSEQSEASLGTLEGNSPFISATSYLFEPDKGEELGNFYLLLSHLARHTKNIRANPHASLLVVEDKKEVPILERARVTVLGVVKEVGGEEEKRIRGAYLKRFPWAKQILELPDFRFYELHPHEIHWVGGFGQIRNWKLSS